MENKQQPDQLKFTRYHNMNNQSCDVKINDIRQFANDVGFPGSLLEGSVSMHT